MFHRHAPIALLAIALIWVSGCGPGKLNETRTWELEGDETRAIDLPAQTKPQTITVEYSSPEEVTVYVFKEEDARGEEGLLNAPANSKKCLPPSPKRGKSESFSVDIPENTATRVVVRPSGKATKVDLKITNKK